MAEDQPGRGARAPAPNRPRRLPDHAWVRLVLTALAVGLVVTGAGLALRSENPGPSARPGQAAQLPVGSPGSGTPARSRDLARGLGSLPAAGPDAAIGPAGTRWVGIGHAAIAVPQAWATNALRCGTPTAPTVVVDVTVIETCGWLSPEVHDSVWLESGNLRAFRPVEDLEVDGVAARRDAPSCTPAADRPTRCSGALVVPSEHASFRAEASSPERVEQILSWVHVDLDRVAVPGFGPSDADHQGDDAGEHYREALAAAGLGVAVVTEARPGAPAGYVLDVAPRPGTLLAPGQVVTMTEVAEPRGPADEVHVEVTAVGPGDSMDYRGLGDAQVRADGRIRLEPGSTIWVHGYGGGIRTLAGHVAGAALVPDDWEQGPNYGRSWKAARRGSSTLRVTLTADGRQVTLGTVTVVVR